MTPDAGVVLGILERLAERQGDPTLLIYERLFAAHPELEALFVMDRDGGVRASMVQISLECILDYVGDRRTAINIVSAARAHHEGYGVPARLFNAFWIAMTEAFRAALAEDWTPEIEQHWGALMQALAAID